MRISRHSLLRGTAAVYGASALTGCAEVARRLSPVALPEQVAVDDVPPDDPHWRALNRMAFGPSPGEIERVREIGLDAYVEEQLAPDRIEEAPAAWVRLQSFDTLDLDPEDARDFETATYPEVGRGQAARELQQACLLRAIYSRRQLQEVLVEFWTDYFHVSQLKGECSWLKTVDDRAVRKHALGKFRDLLLASARSPAMLFYLDNHVNRRAGVGAGLNENYARELLELHTLGVDGGYTQKDVREVARCFTGWSYRRELLGYGRFEFQAQHHDAGDKQVLGTLIAGRRGARGIREGEEVIDLLCRHPSTAEYVAARLCRRFVADRPPTPLVARIAEVFRKTDGDVRQMVSELLHSDAFRHGTGRKLKRPFHFVVSALRSVGADTTGAGVLPYLEKLGQTPYHWGTPDGYPDQTSAWLSTLGARWSFAAELLAGNVEGTGVPVTELLQRHSGNTPESLCGFFARLVLGRRLEPGREQIVLVASGIRPNLQDEAGARRMLALLLAAPEFQWR